MRRRPSARRPGNYVRYLAWLCLFLVLWPDFTVAADTPPQGAVPVVARISGAVVVHSPGGVSRDVIASRILHSGDSVVTGVDSIAVLSLADVGSVRLGPTSSAKATASDSSLTVGLDAGSSCAQAVSKAISIQAGPLTVSAAEDTAIFSLLRDSGTTTIAVYQGSVVAAVSGRPAPTVLHEGEAAVSTGGGSPVQVSIQSVQPQFAALGCPDDAIIARAVPSPQPNQTSGGHGGGGGGGFLGILLGIGALAALAGGHGGGGGGGGAPATPTPTPGPGVLTVNPNSLSFLEAGAAQTFTASESNYSGKISAVSGDTSIATVSPASGSGSALVTFTVSPGGPGSTSITVTDDHGGLKVVSITVTPPGMLMVTLNSLSFLQGGAAQTFSASESSYNGPISAVSGDTTVATVSPASGSGSSPVTFTVTPVGPGTTSITVADNHGGSQAVSVTVTPPGSISVTPGNLTFAVGGSAQTFSASESSYTGSITATSNDTTVATVSGAGTGPGPVIFTVTPVGAGTTTIRVKGGDGPATVNVTVAGPVGVNPTSLTFNGTTTGQSFQATDPFFGGALSASSDTPGVATVSPSSLGGPGPVTFNVTPVSEGSAKITVSDTLGQSAQVSIAVSAGGLVVNPSTLTFTVTGTSQTFAASESDYTGSITATSNHPGQASVSPGSGKGPGPINFTVTPVAAGNPVISVTDVGATNPTTKFVDVTVTGPLTPTPASLTFNGTTASQTIGVTDPNYSGSISASSTDVSVATVTSPGTGPNASFSVTPSNQPGASSSATIKFSDANGGTASASVTVDAGALGVDKGSISLVGAGSTDTFNASETLYSGPINASSGDTTVATVTPASGNGPGPVAFAVKAVGPGSATISVSDNHGGTTSVSVSVTETPSVSPQTLPAFMDVGAASAQGVSISEPGYTGTFSVVSNSCTSIASVGSPAGTGPNTGLSVTALATTASGGTCAFSIKDDTNGGVSSPVSVTVGPFGKVTPSSSSLSFGDVGAGAAQTFSISETNYSGNFTLDTSSCPSSVATVNPTSGSAGTTFTVTPVNSGTCTINVNDDHTQSSSVVATVASFGPITPTQTSLSFTDIGAAAAQTFVATESGYTGTLSADGSACAGIATVGPASGPSGTTFTVTPVAAGGPCNINLTDDHSESAQVSVTVGPFGALTPSKNTSSITSIGGMDSFTVTETIYTGPINAVSSNTAAATVSPASGTGPGPVTFTITSVAVGNTNITVTDDHGGSATVLVTVTLGTLTVSPATLSFASSSSSSQPFTATDSAGPVTFSASSSDTSVAVVLPVGPQVGPGPVTFTVSPGINTGRASITVTDASGGQAVVSVGVGVSPLLKKRLPAKLHHPAHVPAPKPGGTHGVNRPPGRPVLPPRRPGSVPGLPQTPGQPPAAYGPLTVTRASLTFAAGARPAPVLIVETGYLRLFSVSSSNSAVAAVAGVLRGPQAQVMIVPRAPGMAVIRVADDRGGVQTIMVVVRPALRATPRAPGRATPR